MIVEKEELAGMINCAERRPNSDLTRMFSGLSTYGQRLFRISSAHRVISGIFS